MPDLSSKKLYVVARNLMLKGKGILAADESTRTANKRFAAIDIAETPETRRQWRELLFTSPGVEEGLSGVILFDETIRQSSKAGVPFPKLLAERGILVGIKVDQKTEALEGSPKEEVTQGLAGLQERLLEYSAMGAKFAKWRAIIRIGEGLPTQMCLRENARRMAEYGRECEKAGLVPIVEPEVLLDGSHTIERCGEVLVETLKTVFSALSASGIDLKGLILKTSMVLPGKDSNQVASASEVASATVRALLAAVPKEVAGVAFLSGGQSPVQATENLNEIAKLVKLGGTPWPITFSYSRALQEPVLKRWAGKAENAEAAQEIFRRRVLAAAAASLGRYLPEME